jgi:glutathione S-transferase
MIKLYYAPGVCSLSPHIVLRETNTPFALVKTDIRAKKVEDGSDFFTVNPNGYVPALKLDDGTILTEGPAIVQYIADKAGATSLAPANGTLERYKLQSWLNFVSTELHKGFSPLFNPKMPAEGKAVVGERLHERFAYLEKHLSAHDFLMGSQFTLADAYLFTVLGWTKPLAIDMGRYPNLEAYRARILARPAVRDAMRAEGLIK